MPETVTRPHESAMLAAGWLAVRDLSGAVTHWQDPNEPRNRWEAWEARAAYYAGDYRNVPRVRARVNGHKQTRSSNTRK